MAKFVTPVGNLLNSLNSKNLRNVQNYSQTIVWSFETNEEFISARIVDEGVEHIPKGLKKTWTSTSLTLSGLPDDVDLYHPKMITYLWSGFKLDGTEFKDTNYEEKATIEDIKNQDMHYTGKSWGTKGIAGYYRDNNILTFPFTVEVTYWEYSGSSSKTNSVSKNTRESGSDGLKVQRTMTQDYYITVVPNMDPALFCKKYGDAHGFKGPNGEDFNYDQYKAYMVSLGLDFLTIDRSQAT
ncbi:hypothetical phage protein [Campylobacter phage CPt10]|uniref:Uncharacterized protein n=2 Tax=Firehammervirus CPt10 TaxID=722418 RepID=A0A410T7A1_9CAUD|nr:hypothetical protein APL46_gp110 [Campylobacter phage CPt10]QAU04849.1 hypothetical protein [Campylobacter phage CP20]CBJ94312.1 hypothetical phage protein [Campylobacter phage CPt10]